MKPAPTLVCLALTLALAPAVFAEPLSEADRQALIGELDALKDEARTTAAGRLDGAAAAFAKAMKSSEAALALYVDCVEKADFIQRDRSSQDFREWKRRNRDRLGNESFALALRHQLRWTALTLRAATEPDNAPSLADEALEVLDGIYRDPKKLRGQAQVLGQSVSDTVFARAYGLNGYRIEGWPMSPIEVERDGSISAIDGPFRKLIFPAYRKAKNAEALRQAWERRIHFEEVVAGFWNGSQPTENGASPEREKFLLEKKPELVWDMQEDLFKAGDEKSAAVAMMEHLRANIRHSRAREWESRFRELVNPTKENTAGDTEVPDDAG